MVPVALPHWMPLELSLSITMGIFPRCGRNLRRAQVRLFRPKVVLHAARLDVLMVYAYAKLALARPDPA
jgi:hypothetical protein